MFTKFYIEYRWKVIISVENLDEWEPVKQWAARGYDKRGLGQYMSFHCQSNHDKYPIFTQSLDFKKHKSNGRTKWNKTLEEWSKEQGIFNLLFD